MKEMKLTKCLSFTFIGYEDNASEPNVVVNKDKEIFMISNRGGLNRDSICNHWEDKWIKGNASAIIVFSS